MQVKNENSELEEALENAREKADKIVTDIAVLRQISRPTNLKELEKLNFKTRIQRALQWAWTPGFGLAAIQIGIPIRAAWFRVKNHKTGEVWEKLLWNPEVLKSEGVFYFPEEGCLSVPNKRMTTQRFQKITVKNGDGEIIEAEGLRAVILQHEIDHQNGILCVDRIVKAKDLPGRNDPCPCSSGKKFKKCCLK